MECKDIETDKSKQKDNSLIKLVTNLIETPKTQFLKLNKDTNLNSCDNWFWKSSTLNYFNKWTHKKRSDAFSSFKMIETYLDQSFIGEVDVVSDAEIIKQLLKMPFNKSSHLSVMVHRVGKSLFIDEFDIHKYLLKMEEQLTRLSKTREALNDRDLLLKFLCYSIGKNNQLSSLKSDTDMPNKSTNNEFLSNVFWTFNNMKMLIGTNMPIFGDETRPAVTLRLQNMRKPISILTGLDYWLDNLICNIPELHMCYHLDGIVQNYEIIATEDIPYLPGSEFPPNAIKTIAKNILSFLKSNVTKEGHTYWLFKGPDDEIVKLYDLTSLCEGYINDKYDNAYTVPVAMLLYRVAHNLINNNTVDDADTDTISTLLLQCLQMLDKTKHYEVYHNACYLLADLYIKDSLIGEENIGEPMAHDKFHAKKQQPSQGANGTKPLAPQSQVDTRLRSKNNSVSTFNLNTLLKKDLTQSTINDTNDNSGSAHCDDSVDVKLRDFKTSVDNSFVERARFSIGYLIQALEALEIKEMLQKQEENEKEKRKFTDLNTQSNYVENIYDFAKPERVIPLKFHRCNAQTDNSTQLLPINKNFKKLLNLNKALIYQKLSIAYYYLARNSIQSKLWGNIFKNLKLSLHCYFARKHLWPYDDLNSINLSTILFKIISLSGDCRLLMINDLKYKSKTEIQSMQTDYLQGFDCLTANETSLLDMISLHVTDWHSVRINEDDKDMNANVVDSLKKLKFIYDLNLETFELNYFYTEDTYNLIIKNLNKLNKYDMDDVRKRYANVKNELGTHYLNECSNLIKYDTETFQVLKLIENLLDKSFICFNDGLSCFECIYDYANCALLSANCAKLWRVYSRFFTECFANNVRDNLNDENLSSQVLITKAQSSLSSVFNLITADYLNLNRIELLNREKICLLKAIDYYLKAIRYFDHKDLNQQNQYLLNSINWDLSSTYFSLACLLQDNNFTVDNEKLIIEYMNASIDNLKLVNLKTYSLDHNLKKIDIDTRLAVIHHRLASLYHHLYRQQENESKKKHLKSLGDLHYDKSSSYYSLAGNDNVCDRLRVLLEHVALLEFHFESSTSNAIKLKDLENILKILLKCKNCFAILSASSAEFDDEDNLHVLNETNKLTNIFVQRLQYALKNVFKIHSAKKKQSSQEAGFCEKLKAFYKTSLSNFHLTQTPVPQMSLLIDPNELVKFLVEIEENLNN